MPIALRSILAACVMAGLLVFVGFYQSWSLSFAIINMCLVSAVMALGVNIQWGYAGPVSYTHLTLPTICSV